MKEKALGSTSSFFLSRLFSPILTSDDDDYPIRHLQVRQTRVARIYYCLLGHVQDGSVELAAWPWHVKNIFTLRCTYVPSSPLVHVAVAVALIPSSLIY